jgi:hypothetical protein
MSNMPVSTVQSITRSDVLQSFIQCMSAIVVLSTAAGMSHRCRISVQ